MNFHDVQPIATLRIPRAGMPWVTANQRIHWTTRHRQTMEWKKMTLLQAFRQEFPKNLPYCEIQPTYVFSSKRHRDPGNFVLTTKAIVDALCTGKKPPHGWGSWVDDDPRYLRELMPILLVVPDSPSDGVIIRCYPKDAP